MAQPPRCRRMCRPRPLSRCRRFHQAMIANSVAMVTVSLYLNVAFFRTLHRGDRLTHPRHQDVHRGRCSSSLGFGGQPVRSPCRSAEAVEGGTASRSPRCASAPQPKSHPPARRPVEQTQARTRLRCGRRGPRPGHEAMDRGRGVRNILGERVLGLPGAVPVDKDLPWSEVPRH